VRIMINGEWQEKASPLTLAALLQDLSLEPRRVAIELNKRIVRRADYAATELSDNDQLEIVTLMGGG